jgi:lysophospholipase L1-like esterase
MVGVTRLSRRRKLLYATAALCGAAGLGLTILLAADLYVHMRTQELGGVNVWGYRGRPVGRKLPGTRRVVMLGGSTAYGWGLPAHESIAAFLERRLSAAGPTVSVINLGAPAQGAFGFVYDLADFEFLGYDAVILYEGVNDLGPYVARGINNDYLWRRSSPVFRVTGYFPILPVVLRDKAMALVSPRGSGADSPVVFTPGLATRATAAALRTAADVGDQVSEQLGRLSDTPGRPVVDNQCIPIWKAYCASVKDAVTWLLARNKPVVVVTQPYISDAHVEQQANLAAMLQAAFGGDRRVRYLNLGTAIDMRDRSVAYDGVHLVASGNDIVASQMVEAVAGLLGETLR